MADTHHQEEEHHGDVHIDAEDSSDHEVVSFLYTVGLFHKLRSLTIITLQDTFEDANDSNRLDITSPISPNPSTRSLTQRPISTTSIPKDEENTHASDAEPSPKIAEHVNGVDSEKMLEAELQKEDTTLENKQISNQANGPPPVPRRQSKISVDNSTLDNVDLEGEGEANETTNSDVKGRYHPTMATLVPLIGFTNLWLSKIIRCSAN